MARHLVHPELGDGSVPHEVDHLPERRIELDEDALLRSRAYRVVAVVLPAEEAARPFCAVASFYLYGLYVLS